MICLKMQRSNTWLKSFGLQIGQKCTLSNLWFWFLADCQVFLLKVWTWSLDRNWRIPCGIWRTRPQPWASPKTSLSSDGAHYRGLLRNSTSERSQRRHLPPTPGCGFLLSPSTSCSSSWSRSGEAQFIRFSGQRQSPRRERGLLSYGLCPEPTALLPVLSWTHFPSLQDQVELDRV